MATANKTCLKHIVLFKPKQELSQEKEEKILQELKELKDHCKLVKCLAFGRDVSIEGCDEGFKYAYIFDLPDKEALKEWYKCPQVKEFCSKSKQCFEKYVVIDICAEVPEALN